MLDVDGTIAGPAPARRIPAQSIESEFFFTEPDDVSDVDSIVGIAIRSRPWLAYPPPIPHPYISRPFSRMVAVIELSVQGLISVAGMPRAFRRVVS